jgi:hypothetical protein
MPTTHQLDHLKNGKFDLSAPTIKPQKIPGTLKTPEEQAAIDKKVQAEDDFLYGPSGSDTNQVNTSSSSGSNVNNPVDTTASESSATNASESAGTNASESTGTNASGSTGTNDNASGSTGTNSNIKNSNQNEIDDDDDLYNFD